MRAMIIATAVLLTAACASDIEIQTDYNRTTDFAALETFAWQDPGVSTTGTYDPDVARRVEAIVRSSVVENLTAKGYREVSDREPDFLVSYHVVVTEEEDPRLYEERLNVFDSADLDPGESFQVYREDLRINQGIIRKGTLILFFVEPASKRLVWQGIAAGTAISPRDALRKSGQAVDGMLAEFPPGEAGEDRPPR
ncbi:MAG TPA: DUF4136 domain-containing protein [Gammaproteobacteria bacterium]|nr:DUF4136 domain-containing protein [Gammaproteobacteria bacterium]